MKLKAASKSRHFNMTKPVIVCDIDDVLFPFVEGMAEYHNVLKGTTLSAKDFISYDFSQVWGGTQAEADNIVDAFLHQDNLELKPVIGAQQALEELSHTFKIVLVTARNDVFSRKTAIWLKAHFNDLFEDIIFAGNPYDGRGYRHKGDICKELGAVLIIDDHPKNILSAIEQGVDGILFGEHAWTKEAHLENVKKCKDWEAVVEYLVYEWQPAKL